MKNQIKFISAAIVALGFYSAAYAAPTAQDKADAGNINTACAAEAKTAGCGSEVVGKGLLKCMGAYKKANKSFQYSPACKASIKQLHSDKKAGK
jgi:hypothetical protein